MTNRNPLLRIFLFFSFTSLLFSSSVFAEPESIFIQIQTTKLRSSPKQFAPGVMDLKFGDSASVIAKESVWYKVRMASGQEGFIHESAVSAKKIVLSSQQRTLADIAVDDSQVYLAGKGFNGSVERIYSEQNKEANFAAIDALQNSPRPSEEAISEFIRIGKLRDE